MMGFPSYLEDIIARFEGFEKVINEHNETSSTKVDIIEYLQIRKEVLSVLEIIRPLLGQNINILENAKLIKAKQELEAQFGSLDVQEQDYEKKMLQMQNDKAEIESFLSEKSSIMKKLEKLESENFEVKRNIKNLENSYTDLMFDFDSILKELDKIVKIERWNQRSEKVRELERIVRMGINKL